MQHYIVLKKLNFGVLGDGLGSAGKAFATVLLHFVISVNLICNRNVF